MEHTYFDLFSLPIRFDVDQSALKRRFYQLSRELHPDHHTHAPDDEQLAITEKYATINKAFKVLSDDFSRRQYVLEMKGVVTGNDDKLPSDFLMEMMEINEEVETLITSDSIHANLQANDIISVYENALYEELKALQQQSDDLEQSDADLLNKIKECHLKTRYLLRIREKVANIAAP